MKKITFHTAVVIGVLAMGCRPIEKPKSRFKSGVATTASVSILLSNDRKVEVVHNHPDSGPENFKAEKVALSLPALAKTPVDLSKISQKQVGLTQLDFKLTMDASAGAKKLSCSDAIVSAIGVPVRVSCLLQGEVATDSAITSTNFKIPSDLSENSRLAWTDMAKACSAGSGNSQFGSSANVLVGCYCAKPGVQLAFRDYDSLVSVSPDASAEQFQKECSATTSGRTKLVDELAAKCVAPFGQTEWIQNVDSCGCSTSTQSVVVRYGDFFSVESPVLAFEARIKSVCTDSSANSNSPVDEPHPDDGLFDQ